MEKLVMLGVFDLLKLATAARRRVRGLSVLGKI